MLSRSRSAMFAALSSALLAIPAWSQQPDLRVLTVDDSAISGNWQSLAIAGPLDVLIENAGTVSAGGSFDVVAFEDENGNGTYETGTDKLLGSTSLPDLAATTQQNVPVPVSGMVDFRENLIFVALDTANSIVESDETNNVADSGDGCAITPSPGAVNPVLQWSWTSTTVQPTSLNVMMTPVVIDVNGDQIPDVVFGSTSSTGGGSIEVGILRALSGANGAEIWSVTDPSLMVNTAYNVAAGDIDNDGLAEIIACDNTGGRLICFENDGTFKWRSVVLAAQNWGAASIADLDGDGNPEIISGRQVLDNNGNLLWTGTGGSSSPGSIGPLSLVCDFDLDGSPNVLGGNTVYTSTGAILCQNAALPDGYNAVGNFDADPEPEAVLVSGGTIRLIQRDPGNPASLSTVWGPLVIPGGGFGGPPTIADYDGDGLPEIGVAGASRYAVYEHDGTLKWTAVTQDASSNRTGSSVFDFNGDGSAEVVYRDELFLRVYKGTDGTVLFSTPMSSCTWHEYVMVADVDADGNAEIVACANNNCGVGPQRGIFVFKDANDDWVPTRRIWNQHTYHITNVEEDGSIPLVENNNWLFPAALPFNNYRQNSLSTLQPNAAPDLTACRIQVNPSQDTLIARIGNAGAAFVGAGIPVSFYDGDPGSGGLLLGTVSTTTLLNPGEFEDVSLFVGTVPPLVYVKADDTGTGTGIENECDETNNLHSVEVNLTPPVAYCTAKVNSLGCTPVIGWTGAPSASAGSGFYVLATQERNNKPGLVMYSLTGRDARPFQRGWLCIYIPILRTPQVNSGGNPPPLNDCSGIFAIDMNAFAFGTLGGNPSPALTTPATQINCQWWGRDKGGFYGTSLSEGLEYFVGP